MADDEKAAPRTVKLGGLQASCLGFGCMGITAFYGPRMDDNDAVALLRGVFDAGCTHFDTAEAYRSSNPDVVYNETTIGKFFQTIPRNSFTIATKYLPALHEDKVDVETVQQAVEDSLQRLGLQHIDLYYLHRMPPSGLPGLLEWMQAAKTLVEKGKITEIGLSEVCGDWLRAAHAVHPVACIQQEWSLMTRNLEDKLIPVCAELNIGVVAYSPLARNLLAKQQEAPPQDWRARNPRFSKENLEKKIIF
jgi:aryl-alcohol dehydrogenase-like predicted oxidoreductase